MNCASGRFRSSSLRLTRPTLTAVIFIVADCTRLRLRRLSPGLYPGPVTFIGCPKLDEGDYSESSPPFWLKNDIRSVTVVRMAVPCCGGIQRAAERAVSASGKPLSLHTVIVGTDARAAPPGLTHTLQLCLLFSGETCISIPNFRPSLAKPPRNSILFWDREGEVEHGGPNCTLGFETPRVPPSPHFRGYRRRVSV